MTDVTSPFSQLSISNVSAVLVRIMVHQSTTGMCPELKCFLVYGKGKLTSAFKILTRNHLKWFYEQEEEEKEEALYAG